MAGPQRSPAPGPQSAPSARGRGGQYAHNPASAGSQAPDPPRAPGGWHQHGDGTLHAHGDDPAHGADHTHDAPGPDAQTLWSVGIDIGSSTTHMTVSQLIVGRPQSVVHHKPEVLERRLVYRSPITFTPFLDDVTIDVAAIERLVTAGYDMVGIAAPQIAAGAVICTGLAALKRNAAAITARLAAESGRFVCATAGHHFEAILAARGSGSVAHSRRLDGTVANLDVGGGTTKLTLAGDGVIVDTAALAVGARLVVTDDQGRVTRIEPAAAPLLTAAGVSLAVGAPLAPDARARLAEVMAAAICAFAGLASAGPLAAVGARLARELLLTDPPTHGRAPDWVICSGGVSEYVYGWQPTACNDLGAALGAALRAALDARLPAGRLLEPLEGIRATVIGACQYSVQVSGDTVYLSDAGLLPVHNVPVLPVPLDWHALAAETVEQAVTRTLQRAELAGACALAFRGPRRFGYGIVDALASGVAAALRARRSDAPLVLAFDQDLANTVGRAVAARLAGKVPLLCVDELTLGELDYLDLGEPPPGETYVPVVVKSLVFAG